MFEDGLVVFYSVLNWVVKMINEKTILIVDDTESNIDILLELLNNYDLVVATDGQSAIEIAKSEQIDLILLDILMPKMNGFEVCKHLKGEETTKNIPIIFITAKTDEASIETAYDVGGIDYVAKPFKPKELLARVRRELKLGCLIKNLHHLAAHDAMTGIYNRRKFFELAGKCFKTHNNLFIVMLDIDDFKIINDQYGHAMGDTVIKTVVCVIASFIDQSIFGRLGGEEFAILCHSQSSQVVIDKVEKIREAVEHVDVMTDDNKIVNVTISGGISQKQQDTQNLDHLLKKADDLLYHAKHKGKNRVIF